MDEGTSVQSTASVHELQRRIGRNLLIYQQLEWMLKTLLANSGYHGPLSQLPAIAGARAKRVGKLSLGSLVALYVKEVLTSRPDDDPLASAEIDEPWLGFSVHLQSTPGIIARDKATLRALVKKRNALAHTYLQACDLGEAKDVEAALVTLNVDGDDARAVARHLAQLLEALEAQRLEHARLLASDDFRTQFERAWLQLSPIAQTLTAICAESRRADGWTDIADAGRRLHLQVPDEMKAMKQRYGHDSLKRLVIATELFDVLPDGGDGQRTLIRRRTQSLAGDASLPA
jgi:hypothetical protein